MAFGKKKDDTATPDAEDSVDIEAPADEAPTDATPDAEAAPEEPAAVEAVAAVPAEAPGTDALLSMFQESKTEVNDLATLVDLAGEADLDDILEELRTLRAALGITDAFDEEEDFAAAA
jgi:hypothetical protein